jgi:acetyl esterase/lipase
MVRLILLFLVFLLSLLCIFPTPSHYTWYFSIMVTEFPWIFLILSAILVIWVLRSKKYKAAGLALGILSFILFLCPVVGAYMVGSNLEQRFEDAFGPGTARLTGLRQHSAFSMGRMITGIGAETIPFTSYKYATHTGVDLSLDFYKAQAPGLRPCIVVAHGGSWKSGNSHELPDIDWYLARQGYNVASINYRLAPEYKSPAPIEDMKGALDYLKANAAVLNIDTNNFVLLGRSAGGHIVLESAYTMHDPDIKGVVGLYGPTDMEWAYHHPDNPLVMHSQKVMEDFFGGTDTQVPEKYAEGSPINYVTAQSTPTLLVHGGNDAHVNYELSKMLDSKLQDNKVPHLLLGMPWATHGCEYSLNGPSGQLYKYCVERFVNHVTGGAHSK